jgi:hypothetical protein
MFATMPGTTMVIFLKIVLSLISKKVIRI